MSICVVQRIFQEARAREALGPTVGPYCARSSKVVLYECTLNELTNTNNTVIERVLLTIRVFMQSLGYRQRISAHHLLHLDTCTCGWKLEETSVTSQLQQKGKRQQD